MKSTTDASVGPDARRIIAVLLAAAAPRARARRQRRSDGAGASAAAHRAGHDRRRRASGPGATQAAVDAFDAQVGAVRGRSTPTSTVGRGVQLDGPTFAAQLAGGSLPDVFTIPFTDGKA